MNHPTMSLTSITLTLFVTFVIILAVDRILDRRRNRSLDQPGPRESDESEPWSAWRTTQI